MRVMQKVISKGYWGRFVHKTTGCLDLAKHSPAKQRIPWALATTATTITMTMMRATMTIAMTGPLPASGKRNVSKNLFSHGQMCGIIVTVWGQACHKTNRSFAPSPVQGKCDQGKLRRIVFKRGSLGIIWVS